MMPQLLLTLLMICVCVHARTLRNLGVGEFDVADVREIMEALYDEEGATEQGDLLWGQVNFDVEEIELELSDSYN